MTGASNKAMGGVFETRALKHGYPETVCRKSNLKIHNFHGNHSDKHAM